MKKNAGITLVALVITVIILLILAGVAISMITGGDGLFAKANDAATKYNQAAQNEADMLNQLLNSNYLNNGGNGDDPATVVTTTDSYVGYYADMNGDGTVDGIIFADLAKGGSGEWGTNGNGAYTIPVKTGLKEYYISQTDYEGAFGTKDVLSPKEDTTGEDRFYIMALEDVGGTTTYTWYKNATNMTDYETATSVDFGTGRDNTDTISDYWDKKTYGEQDSRDMWGAIQGKVEEGWFVPSRAEWAAFAQELGITKTNYVNHRLNYVYYSSSQGSASDAWYADFYYGFMDYDGVNYGGIYVCLATTF